MSRNRVVVQISDPWDLGELLQWQPLQGELLRLQGDAVGGRGLIRFDKPISYKGLTCTYAVVSPRHVGVDLTAIERGGKVDSGFTCISDEQAGSAAALDTSNWRGGIAFIGDLERIREEGNARDSDRG
jgi:hypothetical protein